MMISRNKDVCSSEYTVEMYRIISNTELANFPVNTKLV